MSNYEPAVFVSYAWGGESESTVDALEKAFADRNIHIIRDKKDVGYKGSIDEFEQRIGRGQCIILVISDKYLRPEHCMHELVEISANRNLRNRIFPIVLSDGKIYKPTDRLGYISYWDERIQELNKAVKEISVMSNLAGIMADLDTYARIRASFDHLADRLSDMNTLTPALLAANGFARLIDAVQQQIAQDKSDQNADMGTSQANKSRDISITRDAIGNIIISGDHNTISMNSPATNKTSHPSKQTNSKQAFDATLEQLRQPGEFRNQFVDTLLTCNSMSNAAARQYIISELPPDIRFNIGTPNAGAKVQVGHIVQICLGYEDGIQSLIQAIETVEGGSLGLKNVKSLLGLD